MTKNTYIIGPRGDCNYSSLEALPTALLTAAETNFLIYPGVYNAPATMTATNVTFMGLGASSEIVINGGVVLSNASSGTIALENLSIVGSNAIAASGSACITKLGAASTVVKARNVVFSNADFAVSHNGERAFAGLTPQVVLESVDASAVNKAVRANANVNISYSTLNSSANAYFTPISGNPAVTVRVLASTSGGSNTGNCTKTIVALAT